MKTKVIPEGDRQTQLFITDLQFDGLIVMVDPSDDRSSEAHHFAGTVIVAGQRNESLIPGIYKNDWNKEAFKPFYGEIRLDSR